jgi:membrane-associated phospholipid phosphatase
LGIGAVLFFVFLGTLFLELEGVLTRFDPQATQLFQSFGHHSLDMPLSLLSLLGSFEITVLILPLLGYWVFLRKKKIYYALGFFFMILVFEFVGKLFLYHPGPPSDYFRYSLPFSFPTSHVQTSFSFPSGHMSRTVYLTVLASGLMLQFLKNKKRAWLISGLLIIFAVLMFYSRVYLGEHWLSDVIGGLFLGSSFAFMTLAYL